MPTETEDSPPVRVRIVETEQAPVERSTIPVSFAVNQIPVMVAPLSNKRVKCILSVTGANVFLCTSQSQALNVSTTYNAGAALVQGVYELNGTGELWLVASQGTTVVGVISEYETR